MNGPIRSAREVREAHEDLRVFFSDWIKRRFALNVDYGPCECSTCKGAVG